MKSGRKSAGDFLFLFILYFKYMSNEINDNQKIRSLCILSLYSIKVQRYNRLKKKKKREVLLTSQYQIEFFTLNKLPKNKRKTRQPKMDDMKEVSHF